MYNSSGCEEQPNIIDRLKLNVMHQIIIERSEFIIPANWDIHCVPFLLVDFTL